MSDTVELLLVEDNPGDVDLAQEVLESSEINLNIVVAMDGEEAVRVLKESESAPQLILLDLNLPRRSGHEVLAEIKGDAMLRRIPVIVLTSSLAERDVTRSYELGANCYLGKPMDLSGYRKVVRAVEEFWLSMAKLPNATVN